LSSIPEKIAILKSVSLLADADQQVLEETAGLLDEQTVRPGQTTFNKGDSGECM
jgi:hypothetical protein